MPNNDPTSGPVPPGEGPTGSYDPTGTDPLTPASEPGAPAGAAASANGTPPRFRPIAFHKEGGMGWVHRALDAELNREVAFKEIKPEYADSPIARRRFLFEAEITGRLEHPGIVPVYGLGRDGFGRPYYAMRFVDGLSLREAVKAFHESPDPAGTERVVALRRLLSHFVTICQTIGYAHSRGVIHRDLKPANVMLGPFGETLIVDWGVARRLHAGAGEMESVASSTPTAELDPNSPTWSARGTRIGTPPYWSPEQAAGRPDLHDERTDVYGLGAVLFDILTGTPPHPDGRHAAQPPSPRAIRAWVDQGLDAITRKAMAHNPDDRFPSAAALAEEVERWLADQPIAAQRAAVEALTQEAAENPDDLTLAEQLARQRANLGMMFSGMGRDGDAITELTAAAGMFAALAAARAKPRLLAEEANCHLALARSLDSRGQKDEAAAARKKAAEIYQRLIAARPDEYKANLATLMFTHVDRPPAPRLAPEPGTVDVPPSMTGTTAYEPATAPTPGTAPPGDESLGIQTLPPPDVPEPLSPSATDLDEGYIPVRELGRGALGTVFVARDKALDRNVAIKVLHESATHAPAYRTRFLRELRIAASLEHPNIARVYTYGVRKSGQPFMVMEYLEGQDVFQILRERGPGWSAGLLEPLAQAADGLHYAHTRGIIHRDPKPTNIMVLPTGRAVILDWGVAKLLGKPAGGGDESDDLGTSGVGDATATVTGTIMGTPSYMSPEQARGEVERIGPGADIYGLGATLFHVLTGDPPLRSERGLHELLSNLIAGRIPRPREVRPEVPEAIDAVCARAMAYRPEDRYPTAAALAADIRSFLAGRPVAPAPRRGFWGWLTGR